MTAVNAYAEFDYFKATMMGGVASGGAPIDFLTDTLKITLHLSAAAPSLTGDDFYDDLDNELANGDGYTTGGETLASKTVGAPSSGTVPYDCADVVWTFTDTVTFRYGVVRKDSGSAATSPLMLLIDFFGADQAISPGTFTWTPHASGIFTIS